jgi:transposase
VLADDEDDSLPALARAALRPLAQQLTSLEYQIAALDRQLLAWHRINEVSQRLAGIPGVGPVTATSIPLPIERRPHKTLYNRWKRWSEAGGFIRMMEGLSAAQAERRTVMIDATYLKAHRTASSLRVKKGVLRD